MTKRRAFYRNPIAQSPLLRKGGAHAKSKTGQRVRARINTDSAIEEWLDEVEDNSPVQDNGELKLPDFLLVFCFFKYS